MCVCQCDRVQLCVPAAAPPVYLYNSRLFKRRYLNGQVEVCRLISSMWPQSGRCGADRRLCPVSDWGLGLVTGLGLIGWLVPLSELLVQVAGGWHMVELISAAGWIATTHTHTYTFAHTYREVHLPPLSCLIHSPAVPVDPHRDMLQCTS